jgi:hypothetical protein
MSRVCSCHGFGFVLSLEIQRGRDRGMRATGGMPSACFWIFGKGIGDGLDFFVDEIRDSGSISQYIFINSPTTCRNFDLQRQHMSFLAHSYVYIRYPIAGNIEHPSFFFTSKSGDFFV